MVSAAPVGCPHPLHTAWQGTACRDDDAILVDHPADRRNRRCLRDLSACQFHELRDRSRILLLDQRFEILAGIGDCSETLHLRIPCLFRLRDLVRVGGDVTSLPQFSGQGLHCHPGVPDGLDGVHLVCMVSAVVDRHKLHILVFEEAFGTCGKIRHPGTDRDDHVRILCDRVGRIGTCHADAAQAVRMA